MVIRSEHASPYLCQRLSLLVHQTNVLVLAWLRRRARRTGQTGLATRSGVLNTLEDLLPAVIVNLLHQS